MSLNSAPPLVSLYDNDFFAWTEKQAKLLRGLKTLPSDIDIENIAEEIETLGRSELHAVESQIGNILIHLLKIASFPDAQAGAHWRGEIPGFHAGLRRQYLPSMKRRLRLQQEWEGAVASAAAELEAYGQRILDRLPDACPLALDRFTDRSFNVPAALDAILDARTP